MLKVNTKDGWEDTIIYPIIYKFINFVFLTKKKEILCAKDEGTEQQVYSTILLLVLNCHANFFLNVCLALISFYLHQCFWRLTLRVLPDLKKKLL
jgi:hypothetical protein